MSFGGQGARREAGSEGYAEKYRAVVDEGYLKDEPVGQRWGKVEPALWGRRRSHTPTVPQKKPRGGRPAALHVTDDTGRHPVYTCGGGLRMSFNACSHKVSGLRSPAFARCGGR